MEKQEKEIKIPTENKKKHKRKVSIFTVFLWLFLIIVMSVITIGTLTEKNAIEVTDNNWNISLVMYDRNSDTPNQAITDFSWEPTNEDETRQLTMQINYACTTGKEYKPGEIRIEIPGIARDSWSEYYRNKTGGNYTEIYDRWLENYVVVAADKINSNSKQYDWSYYYDEENNLYIFTNNMTIAENENFEGTIQIVYNLYTRFRIETDKEYQAKIKENIQSDEIIAMESNICNFHYKGTKKTYSVSQSAYPNSISDYSKIEDILEDYYWVEYTFYNSNDKGIINTFDNQNDLLEQNDSKECIRVELPENCVMYDRILNKVEPKEGNLYYYLLTTDTNAVGAPEYAYYVGYPKDEYQEGDMVTNTAELWGRYEDEEEMQKLAETTTQTSLVAFNFEYKGELYSIRKYEDTSRCYLHLVQSEGGETTGWQIEIDAFYTDSLMDVEVGDDLLYIRRKNGDLTRLSEDEYYFSHLDIPVFYTYNKYTGNKGEKLIGYEWDVQVRYKGTDEYVTYKTGVTGEGENFVYTTGRIKHNSTLNDHIEFDTKNIVGIKVIIKDLDKTIYNAEIRPYINIHTQDCQEGYDNLYNFSFLQIYHKNADGSRNLINEPTLDSYSTESTRLKIAEYDQATYGTYMQRAYADARIETGRFVLGMSHYLRNFRK